MNGVVQTLPGVEPAGDVEKANHRETLRNLVDGMVMQAVLVAHRVRANVAAGEAKQAAAEAKWLVESVKQVQRLVKELA